MIRNQDFNLVAGGSIPINVEGNYIYFDSATGADQRLRVTSGAGGADVILRPGMDMQLPEMQSTIYVQNVGATPLSGILIVGVGKVTNRLLSGSVTVGNLPADQLVHFGSAQHVIQDSPKTRKQAAADAGRSYAFNFYSFGLASGSRAYALILNLSTGTRKAYVDEVFGQLSIATGIREVAFRKYDFTGTYGVALQGVRAIGDAAMTSISTIITQSGTTAGSIPSVFTSLGLTVSNVQDVFATRGDTSAYRERHDGAIVLQPGQAFAVEILAGAANTEHGASLKWWEE